jgi:hypothetical protein
MEDRTSLLFALLGYRVLDVEVGPDRGRVGFRLTVARHAPVSFLDLV